MQQIILYHTIIKTKSFSVTITHIHPITDYTVAKR